MAASAVGTINRLRLARPPMVELSLQLVLGNPGAQAIWFTVPSSLPVDPSGGVYLVEVRQSQLVVGSFLGSGGFHAVLVPAGGRVTLENLPIAVWSDEAPRQIRLAVVASTVLRIGDDDAAAWFPSDPTSAAHGHADVAAIGVSSTKRTPDRSEVPVQRAADVQTIDLVLAVPPPS